MKTVALLILFSSFHFSLSFASEPKAKYKIVRDEFRSTLVILKKEVYLDVMKAQIPLNTYLIETNGKQIKGLKGRKRKAEIISDINKIQNAYKEYEQVKSTYRFDSSMIDLLPNKLNEVIDSIKTDINKLSQASIHNLLYLGVESDYLEDAQPKKDKAKEQLGSFNLLYANLANLESNSGASGKLHSNHIRVMAKKNMVDSYISMQNELIEQMETCSDSIDKYTSTYYHLWQTNYLKSRDQLSTKHSELLKTISDVMSKY